MKMTKPTLLVLGLLLITLPAFAGTITYTFSELPVGTVVTTQYAGVVFSPGAGGTDPVIAYDGAMPGSPVLSPNPPYAGDFWMTFTGNVSHVEFDSGYWDSLGSGVIQVYDPSLVLLATLTNTGTGVDHFNLSSYGIVGAVYFNSFADPAGADIDNLTFTPTPEPSSLLLLGTGLFGIAGGIRRRLMR